MKFERLLKTNHALNTILYANKRDASAYIFVCQDEMLLDEAVTLFLASRIEKAYGHEKAIERIERGGFADIKYYPKSEDGKVKVDDVKDLLSDVYYTPIELEKKFYVINNANMANEASQNKLLKTLEDTPNSSCIILKCTNLVNILPTIKSRCVKVEISAFAIEEVEKELETLVQKSYPKDDRFYFALGVSEGYVGEALKALEDDLSYNLFSLVRETFLYMKTSKELLHYSALWLNFKQNLNKLLSYTQLFLSDLVLYGEKNGSKIKMKSCVKDYAQLANNGYTSFVAINVLPKVFEAKDKLNFNANPTAVVDWLLYSILEVKNKCQKL